MNDIFDSFDSFESFQYYYEHNINNLLEINRKKSLLLLKNFFIKIYFLSEDVKIKMKYYSIFIYLIFGSCLFKVCNNCKIISFSNILNHIKKNDFYNSENIFFDSKKNFIDECYFHFIHYFNFIRFCKPYKLMISILVNTLLSDLKKETLLSFCFFITEKNFMTLNILELFLSEILPTKMKELFILSCLKKNNIEISRLSNSYLFKNLNFISYSKKIKIYRGELYACNKTKTKIIVKTNDKIVICKCTKNLKNKINVIIDETFVICTRKMKSELKDSFKNYKNLLKDIKYININEDRTKIRFNENNMIIKIN